MTGVTIKVDDEAVRDYLQKLQEKASDLSVPFAAIGEMLLLSHQDRWNAQISPDGMPWILLSTSYSRRKSKNKDKILTLDGFLKQLHYQATADSLDFGTDRIYGAAHQFGVPEKNIPARPFLGLSGEDEVEIKEILANWLRI